MAVFDCVKRGLGTAGDEKGGVWLYSTESNSTPDTGYSFSTTTTITILLLLPRFVFISKHCVAHADLFASPQKSARFDNACVLKTRPLSTPQNPDNKAQT